MKRPSQFFAAAISILFLCVFVSGCGVRDGQQKYTWPDGTKYVGEMKNGKPEGRGTLTHPSYGKFVAEFKYVGEFKGGLPNGQGTLTMADGAKYIGEFTDAKPNGRGTYLWPDGRRYVGQFRDGQMDGTGKMTHSDGKIEDGLWKNGMFWGASASP